MLWTYLTHCHNCRGTHTFNAFTLHPETLNRSISFSQPWVECKCLSYTTVTGKLGIFPWLGCKIHIYCHITLPFLVSYCVRVPSAKRTLNWWIRVLKTAVFWVVSLYSLVDVYRRFRGVCCLHHQGDELIINCNLMYILFTFSTEMHEHTFWTFFSFLFTDSVVNRTAYIQRALTLY
jgi:hypothetical protein